MGNPIANLIVVLVGALVIGATIILGVFAFVALGGIVLVLAGVLGIRLWWLGRKRARLDESDHQPSKSHGTNVIEGEYRVVSERGAQPESDRE